MVRYSKRRSRNRKRHHGGSGLSSLNPTPVDFTTNKSLTEIQRIPLVDPSPILARSQPFIPPRPGAPSPPPPLGPTSGPAFGLKIGPPPLLSFGGSKGGRRKSRRGMRVRSDCFYVGSRGNNKWRCVVRGRDRTRVKRSGSKGGGCGCMSRGGRRKRRKSKRRQGKMKGGQREENCGAIGVINAACAQKEGGRGKSKKRHRKMKGGGDFFKNLFNMGEKNTDSSGNESKHSEKHESKNQKDVDNQPDSSTGKVSAEQPTADKSQGAESSSSHTQQLDFKTLWENAFEHGKISGGKRRKSKKFKKHYMWNTKGKRYIAKSHKQHLRGVKLGHTHKKPKRK